MKIRSEIKIGFTVIVAIALLYFGLNYLKGSDIFTKSKLYYATYDQVDGLKKEDKIQLNGYKVGKVLAVEMQPQDGNRFLVTLEIAEPSLQIPDSSTARIVSTDLLGSKAINLEFSDRTSFLAPGDTMLSGNEEALKSVVEERLRPLEAQISKILEETRDLMAGVKITVSKTNDALEPVKGTIQTLQHTAEDIDSFVVDQNARLAGIMSNIESITQNFERNGDEISAILENLSVVTDSLSRVEFSKVILNASNAMAQVDSVMIKVNNGEGSLGMLLNDPKLYKNLEQASLELDKLLEDVRVNPKRYVHFSVFGRSEKSKDKPKAKARTD